MRIRVFHITGRGMVGLHSHKDSPSLAHYYGTGSLFEHDSDGKYVGERDGCETYVDDHKLNMRLRVLCLIAPRELMEEHS